MYSHTTAIICACVKRIQNSVIKCQFEPFLLKIRSVTLQIMYGVLASNSQQTNSLKTGRKPQP